MRLGRERPKGERGETLPEADPDTPPDSSDPTGICPRCGRASNFAPVNEPIPVSFNWSITSVGPNGAPEPEVMDRVVSLLCRGCRQSTVVVEEQWVGEQPSRSGRGFGVIRYRGIHWWPPPGAADLDEAIPAPIRDAYSEGMRCLSVRAPRAAVVMLRRTLEGVVHDKGSENARKALEKNLAAALGVMAEEGTLDKSLSEWAAEIRVVGNVGAHVDPIDDVSEQEAKGTSRLARQVLHYLYELPASITRTRQRSSSETT